MYCFYLLLYRGLNSTIEMTGSSTKWLEFFTGLIKFLLENSQHLGDLCSGDI